MAPTLRPGSVVIIDTSIHTIDESAWSSDTTARFISSNFARVAMRLVLQKHVHVDPANMLSHCVPEAWRTPDEAELVGKVVAISTFFNGSGAYCSEFRTERPYLSRRAL